MPTIFQQAYDLYVKHMDAMASGVANGMSLSRFYYHSRMADTWKGVMRRHG